MRVTNLAKRGGTGECRCTECDKMLGKVATGGEEVIDIRVSKGKNRFMNYRVKSGSVSVRCICGNVNFLTKKQVYDLKVP